MKKDTEALNKVNNKNEKKAKNTAKEAEQVLECHQEKLPKIIDQILEKARQRGIECDDVDECIRLLNAKIKEDQGKMTGIYNYDIKVFLPFKALGKPILCSAFKTLFEIRIDENKLQRLK